MNTLYQKERFADEKFDIVLLIGQSNAEGFGIGNVENEYQPNDNILQFIDSYPVMYRVNDEGVEALDVPSETTYRINPAAENTRRGVGKLGCFGISFVKKYYDTYLAAGNRRVLLIRAAIGGTGFMRKQWTPDGVLFNRAIDMLDTALNLNKENRLAAILWHQGENEAVDGKGKSYEELYSFYTSSLTRLISDLKEAYGKNVPFIAGNFCEDWTPRFQTESSAIADAARAVIKSFESCGFVETAGLGSNDRIQKGEYPDDAHFNRPALYSLGERYFEIYKNIV